MKLQLTLAKPRALSRSEAWGCVTANLAVPGAGSLAAGRAVGYAQMAVYFTGFILSVISGITFFHWYFANASQINQSKQSDPVGALLSILHASRWVWLGIALFLVALSWSALTSFHIVQAQRKDALPPPIA
ncbi:MAG TPA: hypothetical protein VN765_08825 [Candidatus Acidoferrum sp.]|nr:hypothetical protein [Candidatus Acidoferrum sp.]